ncbi:MAG: hypothetical protein IPK07_22895 [Deltaproteobacteria bacterium]|nr:hypothetical protein [Deltaproteobacteria bacterium]
MNANTIAACSCNPCRCESCRCGEEAKTSSQRTESEPARCCCGPTCRCGERSECAPA